MKKAFRFILGAIMGGMLGSTIVLLFAPGSGDETRTAIQQRISELRVQLQNAMDERRAVLEEEIEKLKTL